MAVLHADAFERSVEELYGAAVQLQVEASAEQALAAYNAVLAEDPWHVGALLHAGALALTCQRDAEARLHYQTLFNQSDAEIAAAFDVTHLRPEGIQSLISFCEAAGRLPLSCLIMEQVTAARPQDAAARANYGRLLLASDRLQDSIMQLRRVTDLEPSDSRHWEALGLAYARTEAMDKAHAALAQAIKLDPAAHMARRELVMVLTRQGRRPEALRHYRVLAMQADDAGILCEAGLAMLGDGDPAGALAAFTKVLGHTPDNCLAGLGAGAAALALKQPEPAIEHMVHALKFVPRSASAIHSLIRCFWGRLPRNALAALFNVGVDVAWDDKVALQALCDDAYGRRFGDAAHKGLTRLQELAPDAPGVLAALIDTRLSVCDWGDVSGLSRDVLDVVDRCIADGRPLNIDVWNLFALGVDYPTLARAAGYKATRLYDDFAPHRQACNFSYPEVARPRIRLGYLCPYTWRSSHIDNLLTVVRQHDRGRFELYGYSVNGWTGDEFDVGFRSQFEEFRYLDQGDPVACARQVHEDGIDILIDSTGHFASTCMPTAAMRPAPVCIHGTAGFNIIGAAPYYDYSLNDRHYLTDDLVDLYVEKPFYMPHSAMPAELLPVDDSLTTRASLDLPEDKFVFADFNHPCKFDPKVYDAWMEILRRVPDSVLLLCCWLEDTAARLHRIARDRGVDPERVIFARLLPRTQHLRRLQFCDLALDTLYHSGGVTTVDSMMAGLPLLTVVPDRKLPLANVSLLAAAGCEDMVMPNLERYVERAVELANRPDELAAIRDRLLAGRADSPLFQAQRWVRNFERACEIINCRRLDGDDPAPFSILDVQDWPA